jgi:hypothetical protein
MTFNKITGSKMTLARILSLTAIFLLQLGANAHAQNAKQPYEYLRGEHIVPCPDDENENCVYHRLIVENQSDKTLECHGQISFDGLDRDKVSSRKHHMVIEPNARKAVVTDVAQVAVRATTHNVDCKARPPLDDSKLTPKCKPTLTSKPTSIDYSSASREAGQEGPVLLEFTLSDKEAAPTEIVVVSSSMWPTLDDAAKKYVAQSSGYTDCKKGRFRMPLTFRLQQ